MISFLVSVCEIPDILNVIFSVKGFLGVVLFLVPMFLIVMMTVDFAKCVIASDVESMKKTFQLSIKRLLMAMALFLVPTIVSATMNLLGELNVEYASCINNAIGYFL